MYSNKWIRKVALILFFNVLMAIPLKAENLTMVLNTEGYQIVMLKEGSHEIRMEGFDKLLIPGKPTLLAKTFLIALPPGAEVSSVNITGSAPVELPGSYRITPAPPPLPMDKRDDMVKRCLVEWQKNYDEVYSSDEVYPEKVGEYLGVSGLRKYTFVRVVFFPFGYKPQSGKLLFYSSAIVSIDYSLPLLDEQGRKKLNLLLSDRVMDNLASQLLFNYSDAKEWYTPEKVEKSVGTTYNYVIITTDALTDAVSPLVNWKEMIGYNVNVVTTSWIQSNYSGSDLEQKIRNFLIDKHVAWGIEYVLLAGDIDVIPMRHCYPDPSNHGTDEDYCPPTDYYYADLTGNWDSDGDGYYGEYGQDAVDFYPEVYVGRIPWSSATTLSNICQKIANFEGDSGPWKSNALLLGAMSNYANEDFSGWDRTDGASLMEFMISGMLTGWSYTTMYEKAGLSPSAYTCDFPLSHFNVINNWSSNDYGIVNWWAHGGPTDAWRKWWAWDDGDGVPESNEMSWDAFIRNSDVSALDDNHPSIIFSCSCNNGWPEQDNLGKELLNHGSAGIVASTRISWYTIGWQYWKGGNASIDYYFFYYMINNDEKVGNALFDSKIYYLNHYFWWGWQSQQNMFDFCLYGDPALIQEGMGPDIPVLIAPVDDSFTSDSTITFVWNSTAGPGGSYRLQLANDSLFTVMEVDTPVTDTSLIISLDYGTYYWRAEAITQSQLHSGYQSHPFSLTVYMRGDVNADGGITLVDVIYMANYVLKGGTAPIPMKSADVNCDGKYDLVDVILLARYVLFGEPFPC